MGARASANVWSEIGRQLPKIGKSASDISTIYKAGKKEEAIEDVKEELFTWEDAQKHLQNAANFEGPLQEQGAITGPYAQNIVQEETFGPTVAEKKLTFLEEQMEKQGLKPKDFGLVYKKIAAKVEAERKEKQRQSERTERAEDIETTAVNKQTRALERDRLKAQDKMKITKERGKQRKEYTALIKAPKKYDARNKKGLINDIKKLKNQIVDIEESVRMADGADWGNSYVKLLENSNEALARLEKLRGVKKDVVETSSKTTKTTATTPEQQAEKYLTDKGKPVTPANIQSVIKFKGFK